MVKFKDFSRPLSVFQILSRQILFSRTFQDSPVYLSTFQVCANPETISRGILLGISAQPKIRVIYPDYKIIWFVVQLFNRSVSMRSQALLSNGIECNVIFFLFISLWVLRSNIQWNGSFEYRQLMQGIFLFPFPIENSHLFSQYHVRFFPNKEK